MSGKFGSDYTELTWSFYADVGIVVLLLFVVCRDLYSRATLWELLRDAAEPRVEGEFAERRHERALGKYLFNFI